MVRKLEPKILGQTQEQGILEKNSNRPEHTRDSRQVFLQEQDWTTLPKLTMVTMMYYSNVCIYIYNHFAVFITWEHYVFPYNIIHYWCVHYYTEPASGAQDAQASS